TEIENATPNPQYKEEQKRIEKLVWWDEVKAKVLGISSGGCVSCASCGIGGEFSGKASIDLA
ncbi:hypothetical protein QCE49_33350, partial [Caballeronia sp. LZ008]|uniref:hypothetical protein n=1 Tax=Caballeronia sp. LZ008 TaxID=3038560 RepID=UPI0028619DE1